MRVSRRLFAPLACAAICSLSVFAVAQSDEAIAERVLGPQWKQLSRRAGMIFAGTVLSAGTRTPITVTERLDRSVQVVELTFQVDHQIAGVETGQVLTIHEWAGAWSLQRPMRRGEHLLIFLYAPSRLGLTSPVGGWRGQIALDAGGQNVLEVETLSQSLDVPPLTSPTAPKAPGSRATVTQLARAIRAARGD